MGYLFSIILKLVCAFFLLKLILVLPVSGQVKSKVIVNSKTHIRLPKLIPFRKGDLWGFADSTGKIIVQPKYTQVKPLEDKLAQIFSGSGTGLIDDQGKEILKPIYSNLIYFDKVGIRVDTKEGKHGLIDWNGKQVVPVIYDKAKFLDLPDLGKYLVIVGTATPIPDEHSRFNRNRRKVTLGLFTLAGKEILPIAFSEINYKKEGIIEACKADTCSYITIEGKVFLPPSIQRLSNFKKGVASICDDAGCGYLYRNGQIFISKQFKAANNFSEGLAAVATLDGKWGYINMEGKFVSEAIFEPNEELKNFEQYLEQFGKLNSGPNNNTAGELKNGLALVRQNQKLGFMGRDGKLLTPVEYDKIQSSNFPGKYYLLKGNKSVLGHLDSINGKLVIEENPGMDISPFKEGLASIYKNNLYGYISKDLKLVIPYQFKRVSDFKNGIAVVAKPVPNGMRYGIIDKNNQVLLPFEYGRIEPVGEGLFRVQPIIDNKTLELWGLFTQKGNHLTPMKYTLIGEFKEDVAPFMIGDSFGLLDRNGKEIMKPINIPKDYSECGELKSGIIKICHKQTKKEGYMDIYGRTYFAD